MEQLYPLRFVPIFRRYIWGGNRLRTLGKSIGQETCAESWEIVDHGEDQSVVEFGPFKGKTLGEIVRSHPIQLLGEKVAKKISADSRPMQLKNRFPLLFKFLDATRNLSVQVHPDDEMASELVPPDLGKTEAWYVLDAQPDAKIYAGLKEGVSKSDFALAVEKNETESVLNSFKTQKGDCVFIPAGTIHALGEGLLIAEIQQSSDTTFRLFDWNRLGNDGKPRQLHIEQGIEAIDFNRGPVFPIKPENQNGEPILSCDVFALSLRNIGEKSKLGRDGKCQIVAVLEGSISVAEDQCGNPLEKGDTMLIPASCPELSISGDAIALIASPC